MTHGPRTSGSVPSGDGATTEIDRRVEATTASFLAAARENEEVVPVKTVAWVLPSGIAVGR